MKNFNSAIDKMRTEIISSILCMLNSIPSHRIDISEDEDSGDLPIQTNTGISTITSIVLDEDTVTLIMDDSNGFPEKMDFNTCTLEDLNMLHNFISER